MRSVEELVNRYWQRYMLQIIAPARIQVLLTESGNGQRMAVDYYSTPHTDFDIFEHTPQVFTTIGIDDFVIRINSENLLDDMIIHCGVPTNSMTKVCSSDNKLDKTADWTFLTTFTGVLAATPRTKESLRDVGHRDSGFVGRMIDPNGKREKTIVV